MEVKYFLKDKNKKASPVRAVIRHKGQRYQFTVGESIITKYWNDEKYRCRTVRDYPEASHINARLNDWEEVIKKALNEFGLILPTQKMFKDKVDEILRSRIQQAGGITDKDNEQMLVLFAKKFQLEANRNKDTKKAYLNTINKLELFQKKFRISLRFADIDINFYNKFNKWMLQSTYIKSTKKDKEGNVIEEIRLNYTKNYIGSVIKNIKVFMEAAKEKGLHQFDGYKSKGFKKETEQTDSIYLTENELGKIYSLKFTQELLTEYGYNTRPQNIQRAIQSLESERDRFLIGCYTGLRHSDYSRLETVNFSSDMITIWTKKKDKKVYIPMHHVLRKILKRRNNILPYPISDQKHNDQIKIIGKMAGIEDEVLLTKTRANIRDNIVGKKYEFITSHTARRSGATNMYLAGVDLKFIQDILGHSKIEQTIRYIKVTAEDNAKRLIDHPYFSGK